MTKVFSDDHLKFAKVNYQARDAIFKLLLDREHWAITEDNKAPITEYLSLRHQLAVIAEECNRKRTSRDPVWTRQDLWYLIETHDWYYHYSDDHSAWSAGEKSIALIDSIIKENPEFSDIFVDGKAYKRKESRPEQLDYLDMFPEIFSVIDVHKPDRPEYLKASLNMVSLESLKLYSKIINNTKKLAAMSEDWRNQHGLPLASDAVPFRMRSLLTSENMTKLIKETSSDLNELLFGHPEQKLLNYFTTRDIPYGDSWQLSVRTPNDPKHARLKITYGRMHFFIKPTGKIELTKIWKGSRAQWKK